MKLQTMIKGKNKSPYFQLCHIGVGKVTIAL